MKKLSVVDLKTVFDEVCSLDESFSEGGISTHYVEFERTDADEFLVKGNAEGLIHLASKLLELAVTGVEGKHHHFDESGIVDKCDMPLIVTLEKADWS